LKKFQLGPFGLIVALSGNISPEFGESEKNSVYPLYRPACNKYKSITLQQYKLFRLAFLSLRDLTLCCVQQGNY